MQQASAAPTPDSIDSIAGRDVRRRRAADHEVSLDHTKEAALQAALTGVQATVPGSAA